MNLLANKLFLILTGHMLERSDFGKKYNAKFDFERRWGVSVRHKDVALFDQLFDCPLFEIHFSSDDIELEHSKYFLICMAVN